MSGGFMFVALGVVWFLFFIPSWSNRSAEREQDRNDLAEVRQQAQVEIAKVSASKSAKELGVARRLIRVKWVAALTALIALAATAFSSTLVLSQPAAWFGVALGASVSIIAFAINRSAARTHAQSLAASLGRRKARAFAYTTRASNSDAPLTAQRLEGLADNSWRAPGVPGQIFKGSEGSLVDVTFAQVVELPVPVVEQTLESETLDEILRRRRANG